MGAFFILRNLPQKVKNFAAFAVKTLQQLVNHRQRLLSLPDQLVSAMNEPASPVLHQRREIYLTAVEPGDSLRIAALFYYASTIFVNEKNVFFYHFTELLPFEAGAFFIVTVDVENSAGYNVSANLQNDQRNHRICILAVSTIFVNERTDSFETRLRSRYEQRHR